MQYFILVLLQQSVTVLLQHVSGGLHNRTQTMLEVEGTLQQPSNCASQHALALLSVMDSTGFHKRHRVYSVGWVGLGQVNKATRRASLIMLSTGIVMYQVIIAVNVINVTKTIFIKDL